MSVDKSVLEKIQKLMNMANDAGATEAERGLFYARAQKELLKYNLTEEDLVFGESGYASIEVDQFGRLTMEHQLAYGIAAKYFYVKGYVKDIQVPGKKRMKAFQFFGEETNVQIARHIYTSLLNAFEHLFIQHQIKTRCPQKDRRIFIEGVAMGFCLKMEATLKEAIQESGHSDKTGLALLSQQQKLMNKYEEHSKQMGLVQKATNRTVVKGSAESHRAGIEAGKNLNFNKGLGKTDQKQLN